jgi:hypothetical protein
VKHWRLIATGAAALSSVALLWGAPDHDGVPKAAVGLPAARPEAVSISIAPDTTRAVPDAFLGLSTEYWAMPGFARGRSLFTRVLSLIHVDGDSPVVLRIGGDSADHSFYDPDLRVRPRWMFELTPAWLRDTAELVHRARLRVILDLNLITGSPTRAARWASVADHEFPRGTLRALEIGNEPDIYSRTYWRGVLTRRGPWSAALPGAISARSYAVDFNRYADALADAAPGVPLAGPALANPVTSEGWIRTLLTHDRGRLAVVTAHRYQYSACDKPTAAAFPTVARLLSERASAGMAQRLRRGVAIAHDAGLPFRLSELNSVTCGGRPGVSDSFATALWAPDALFELMRVGVDAVNVHVRVGAINAAFAIGDGGLVARPLLYGLIMFSRALGPGARLIPLRLHTRGTPLLKAWAVQARGRLSVLLVDKQRRPVLARLRVGDRGPATVQRLTAPAPAARTGMRLGGQWLDAEGNWVGHRLLERVAPKHGSYRLLVPAGSAALLTVSGPGPAKPVPGNAAPATRGHGFPVKRPG